MTTVRLILPTVHSLWEVQGLSSISLLFLQQQVISQQPSRETSWGFCQNTEFPQPIQNYQSYLFVGAKLRYRDTTQDHCCVPHFWVLYHTLCSGLASMPLWPENTCYPGVVQQPPISYVKEDDVNPSSSSGLSTLPAMEGVNCSGWF